jgi:hypothetical protein
VPGELATGISRIAGLLPSATRSDLRRLLAHDLAAPQPDRERAMRLALLCEVLEGAGGEVPTVDTYETARREARRDAPAASTLSRHYGGWLLAVRAAAWLAAGASGPAPVVRTLEPQRPYTRDEVLVALERCRRAVGRWPGAAEYEEWARLRRHLGRRFGSNDQRTPGRGVIIRLFGGLREARPAHDS